MSSAEAKFKRADGLYHLAIRAFFVFAFIMLAVIVYQVAHLQGDFTKQQSNAAEQRDKDTAAARKRLEAALAETQNQQVVTQNYIRCVASILLKPVDQRSTSDFDACGIPGVTDPSKLGQPDTNQGSTAPNQQSPAIIPQPTIMPAVPTPTQQSNNTPTQQPVATGAPPDPDERSTLGRLPLVGGLLNAIGL